MTFKLKIKNQKLKIGFTLIEMLVVISIIGILATLVLARLGGVEKAGRDTRRRSDLNQYRTALENFALKNNSLYPSIITTAIDPSGTFCSSTLGPSNMGACPQDPRQDGITYFYRYISNGTGSPSITATNYLLWAQMENYSTITYLYVCSSGRLNTTTSTPTTGLCW